jgi:DNA-binding NarL/FixJ family response regulator
MTSQPRKPTDDPRQVLLVDDEAAVRFSLARLLEQHERFIVVGEAGTARQGVELAIDLQPDIVLLDLLLPAVSGLDALPALACECPRTMIAALSAMDELVDPEVLLEAGAFTYYGKSQLASLPELLDRDYAAFLAALEGEETVPAWYSASLDDTP